MVVLGLSLAVLRTIYLDAVPPTVLAHDAAAVLYDTLVAYLRLGLRTILVLALVIAGGAFLTGPSATALGTRQRLTAGIGRLRGGAEHAGLRTGPVGTWVYANKPLLRIGAVTLAALTLVFSGQPTGKTILVLAGLLLVTLALIEFLGQPPQRTIVAPQPRPEPGSSAANEGPKGNVPKRDRRGRHGPRWARRPSEPSGQERDNGGNRTSS